jgi:hypothetical protein
MIQRSQNSKDEGRYSIRRLLSTRDEGIDLDEAAWMAALDLSRKAWHADAARRRGETEPDEPNGPSMRSILPWPEWVFPRIFQLSSLLGLAFLAAHREPRWNTK